MSKQINFYMTASDLRAFQDYIVELEEGILFVPRMLAKKQLSSLDTLEVNDMGKTDLTIYLLRAQDIDQVKIVKMGDDKNWKVDDLVSPVIELWRSYSDGENIGRGRVYFHDSYYEGEQRVAKNKAFLDFANNIFKWMRKYYEKNEHGFYLAPKVVEGQILEKITLIK